MNQIKEKEKVIQIIPVSKPLVAVFKDDNRE